MAINRDFVLNFSGRNRERFKGLMDKKMGSNVKESKSYV